MHNYLKTISVFKFHLILEKDSHNFLIFPKTIVIGSCITKVKTLRLKLCVHFSLINVEDNPNFLYFSLCLPSSLVPLNTDCV